jgi:Nif-specific regulatory protein
MADDESEIEQLRGERDLYKALLDLDAAEHVDSFLQDVLALLVTVTGARVGYIELRDLQADQREPQWSSLRSSVTVDVEKIRRTLSRGVIAEAIASGRTVATASAVDDPRFRDHASVQEHRIEAVLCVPIGVPVPFGVVYLQGRDRAGSFSREDCARLESIGPHLASLAERLMMREGRKSDPTGDVRKTLRAEGVVGRSSAMAEVLKQVALLAPLDASVLLTGPTGTGKTQLARVIHSNSARMSQPFLEVNCGALPENLLESELFGAVPGAHSTASRRVEGKVAAAEGGTLFLDEIGDLPLASQAALLQMLQSREYFPLGSARPVRANVRVIAATNLDVKTAVAERRFREDLYYRLNVVSIRMPSLSERTEDIPDLVEFLCIKACESHGLAPLRPTAEVLVASQGVEWPGNVRQLANEVAAAAIRAAAERSSRLELKHLFPGATQKSEVATFHGATRAFQSQFLRRALDEADWNVGEVAQRLDLARSHVYNLIRAFGLGRG